MQKQNLAVFVIIVCGKKNSELSKEEFEKIHQLIIDKLQSNSIDATQLIRQLAGINKEKAWKVMHHLQAENKLVVDKNGRLMLNAKC